MAIGVSRWVRVILVATGLITCVPMVLIFLFSVLYGWGVSFCVAFFSVSEWVIQPNVSSVATPCLDSLYNIIQAMAVTTGTSLLEAGTRILTGVGVLIGVGMMLISPFVVAHTCVGKDDEK